MRAKVLFTCENYDCSENGKVYNLTDKAFIIGPHCEQCHGRGALEILAGEYRFKSTDAYVEFLNACAKELKLLRRLESAGSIK